MKISFIIPFISFATFGCSSPIAGNADHADNAILPLVALMTNYGVLPPLIIRVVTNEFHSVQPAQCNTWADCGFAGSCGFYTRCCYGASQGALGTCSCGWGGSNAGHCT